MLMAISLSILPLGFLPVFIRGFLINQDTKFINSSEPRGVVPRPGSISRSWELKWKFSGPSPDPRNQKRWGWASATYTLTNPPSDSNAHSSLRTTDRNQSGFFHVSLPYFHNSFFLLKLPWHSKIIVNIWLSKAPSPGDAISLLGCTLSPSRCLDTQFCLH